MNIKEQMKKLGKVVVAALFIAFVFSACKKDAGNPLSAGSSMNITYNGHALSFNTCIELDATVGTTKEIIITGTNVSGGEASYISFEVEILQDIATLKAGQTFPIATTVGQAGSSTLTFFNGNSYITRPWSQQGTVTITGVTSTIITGTFSGFLFAQSDLNGTTVDYTITKGSFSAKRS